MKTVNDLIEIIKTNAGVIANNNADNNRCQTLKAFAYNDINYITCEAPENVKEELLTLKIRLKILKGFINQERNYNNVIGYAFLIDKINNCLDVIDTEENNI